MKGRIVTNGSPNRGVVMQSAIGSAIQNYATRLEKCFQDNEVVSVAVVAMNKQHYTNMRCIVSNSAVYAKKETPPCGVFLFW
jgi:hypothetical protein